MNKNAPGYIIILFLVGCGVNPRSNYGDTQQSKAAPALSFNDTIFATTTRVLKSNHIPDSVFLMTHLRHLSIMGMDCDYGDRITCWMITEIPPQIGDLKDLVSITMNVNAISTIPKEILQLRKLRSLDLTDNLGLTNIDILSGLENLEKLSLFGCRISKMPLDIGRLKNLTYLGLTGNPISNNEIKRIKKDLPNCQVIFSE